jgi:hypothetical protein
MAEIIAAIDEQAANDLFDLAIAALSPFNDSGTSNLGPFPVTYSLSAKLISGNIDLIPPGTIRLADLRADWNVNFTLSVDLSEILPDFCIPSVCVDIPCVGQVCTPRICIDWPTIPIPVSFGDFVKADIDLGLSVNKVSGNWEVKAIVQGVPSLQFGPGTAGLLIAIGAAATPILLLVPFAGPFLAMAVDAILTGIALAGVTGFLGPIISPFIAGLKIDIYKQPVQFIVLPAESAVDPQVHITIDAIGVDIQHNTPEDELVLTADISP